MAADTTSWQVVHDEDLRREVAGLYPLTLAVYQGEFPRSGEPVLIFEVNSQGLTHYFYRSATDAVFNRTNHALHSRCYGSWQRAFDDGTAEVVLNALRDGKEPPACHATQEACDEATTAYVQQEY